MNFKIFSVDTTNIFPMANTTKGGQLVTEFNLTAREGVASEESIKYKSGPSYVHAEEDFYVSAQKPLDDFFPDTAAVSTSVLQIAPGRGVIDGRFVENLVPMTIDLAAVNEERIAEQQTPLAGNLAVGLKVMYSTEQTMAGTVNASVNSSGGDEYFEGIQVVILPQEEFLLPASKFTNAEGKEIDCGLSENQNYVTAHLLLATFSYFNGNISNIVNNYPEKCQMMPASRIGSIDNVISYDYLRKTGLNEKKLYGFAGKGNTGGENNRDTWCDITDSLIVWDTNVTSTSDENEIKAIEKITQADFISDGNLVKLVLPHKQIDGESTGYNLENANGERVVYEPRILSLPRADFSSGTPGTVDRNYTDCIKAVIGKINNFYQLTNGKQLMYIDILEKREDLPAINEKWSAGDYILVGKDNTLSSELNEQYEINPPASIYVIVPGYVHNIAYTSYKPMGIELDRKVETVYSNDTDYEAKKPNIENSKVYEAYWDISSDIYRGAANRDYFTYEFITISVEVDNATGQEIEKQTVEEYYYIVTSKTTPNEYSDPIQLTAQIPFATEGNVGGFLNVPENTTDAGYVYLDNTGHLRLLDYALLRSGTLAYQLGEDFTVPSGQSVEEVQAFLDEYVNQRIAFPNLNHSQTAEDPNIINITLNLSESEEAAAIDIFDIDSRFQTAVRINILGTANDKITINISDCARVIINSQIGGTPKINLYRSCLYYDADAIEHLNNITDMSLWYAKFKETDASILVDGMTVKLADETGLITSDYNIVGREFWSTENVNDFHFKAALQSLTFSPSGYIVGCGILIGNDSTVNIRTGKFVIHDTDFEIPQGPNTLRFPRNRFISAVHVTGQFIVSYRDESKNQYNIQDTSFSLKTPYYELDKNGGLVSDTPKNGEISFLVDSFLVDSANPETIDVWEAGAFHLFNGSAIY